MYEIRTSNTLAFTCTVLVQCHVFRIFNFLLAPAFYKQINMNLSEAYDYASEVMVENMLKIDAEEGIDAFINKRNPNWQDK